MDEPPTTGEWEGTHSPVVVGVDGSDRNRSAVAWAAHEAAAHGCEIELVTALVDHVVSTPHFSVGRQDEETLAMLRSVRREVRHLVSEQAVDVVAAVGSPVEVMLQRAEHARLLVVGRRGLGGFTRAMVGSTSIGLAGRSPVPVAIVPDLWRQEEHVGEPLVLGIDPYEPDHRPLHLAFLRARRMALPLVAVHGWELPTVLAGDRAKVAETAQEWERKAEDRFREVVSTWRERYPEVDVRAVHVRDHPADAILDVAREAQLVVLGRHRTGFFGGLAFGSVARAVLHYAECPVLVVPSEDRRPERH